MDTLVPQPDKDADRKLRRVILGTGTIVGGLLSATGMVGFASGNVRLGYTAAVGGLVLGSTIAFLQLWEED